MRFSLLVSYTIGKHLCAANNRNLLSVLDSFRRTVFQHFTEQTTYREGLTRNPSKLRSIYSKTLAVHPSKRALANQLTFWRTNVQETHSHKWRGKRISRPCTKRESQPFTAIVARFSESKACGGVKCSCYFCVARE